jgi:hypothetical protein
MMAAAAHQLDDEPQDDPAEDPMSEADFRIIRRASELCDHAPTRHELTAEPDCLITHAVKILGAQIRAAALVREMAERGEFSDLGVTETCLVELRLSDDETDEPPVDWKEVAQAAWHDEGWKDAAVEYRKRGNSSAGMRR